jgi:DNA-binding response OmpR family regulator
MLYIYKFDITTVLKQGLKKRGFQVFAITDPLLALEHFQINSKQYDLVISDPATRGVERAANECRQSFEDYKLKKSSLVITTNLQ